MNKCYHNLIQCAYALEELTDELMDTLFENYNDQMFEIELDEWEQALIEEHEKQRLAAKDDDDRQLRQHYETVFGEKVSKYSYYLEKY